MNCIQKIIFICAVVVPHIAFGYSWSITNDTNYTLVVQFELAGWYNRDTHLGVYINVIQPGRNADFSWGLGNPRAGHCLSSIRIAKWDWTIAGPLPRIEQTGRVDQAKLNTMRNDTSYGGGQDILLEHPLTEPDIIWLENKTWNMFDDEITKAAQEVVTGIASSFEEGAELAGYDLGGLLTNLGGITTDFVELLKKSKCMGRHFNIIEQDGQLVLVTKL